MTDNEGPGSGRGRKDAVVATRQHTSPGADKAAVRAAAPRASSSGASASSGQRHTMPAASSLLTGRAAGSSPLRTPDPAEDMSRGILAEGVRFTLAPVAFTVNEPYSEGDTTMDPTRTTARGRETDGYVAEAPLGTRAQDGRS